MEANIGAVDFHRSWRKLPWKVIPWQLIHLPWGYMKGATIELPIFGKKTFFLMTVLFNPKPSEFRSCLAKYISFFT